MAYDKLDGVSRTMNSSGIRKADVNHAVDADADKRYADTWEIVSRRKSIW
jgi:hypothetical protein